MGQPVDLTLKPRIAVLPGFSMVNNSVSSAYVIVSGRGGGGPRGFSGENPTDPYTAVGPSLLSIDIEAIEL
jgi:hypothetical protein